MAKKIRKIVRKAINPKKKVSRIIVRKSVKNIHKTEKKRFRIPFTRYTFSLVVSFALIGVIYLSSLSKITGFAVGGASAVTFGLLSWIGVLTVIIATYYFVVKK